MKVLIVDDDINTLDAIRRSLDWEKLEIGEVCYAYEIAGAKKILTEDHKKQYLEMQRSQAPRNAHGPKGSKN